MRNLPSMKLQSLEALASHDFGYCVQQQAASRGSVIREEQLSPFKGKYIIYTQLQAKYPSDCVIAVESGLYGDWVRGIGTSENGSHCVGLLMYQYLHVVMTITSIELRSSKTISSAWCVRHRMYICDNCTIDCMAAHEPILAPDIMPTIASSFNSATTFQSNYRARPTLYFFKHISLP